MNLKSDIGAQAAWKGFSTQTLYIAYRLMILYEEYEMAPETEEDLMVLDKNDISELVQVKNLSSNLVLSDLNPKKEDSFFRRVLKYKDKNIVIKVVSFGNIGEELNGVIKKDDKYLKSFKEKMQCYKYSDDEINWIIRHLEIEKVDENDIRKNIYEMLKDDFKSSIASDIIFENLINYVSKLSRKKEKTTRKNWEEKVDKIIKDIMSIKGMYEQYGRTIINLKEYKSTKSYEELEKEYRNCVDTKPDHIRNNFDITREKWMEKIENAFKYNNIVIIRGVSGQGKSTLAYRYLMENYTEDYIFVVEHVIDSKQAEDILLAIKGLSGTKEEETIVYIDIASYDTNWKWIVEQVDKVSANIKILITIREEDFRRTNLECPKVRISELELSLEEEEAKQIYNIYGSDKFINFEDAWNKFGKKGPFMEFIYLLKENQTLKSKLSNQIDNIIENEQDADNWLEFLLLVSYMGQENLRLDLKKVKGLINSNNISKMIKNMQEEYLIKISDDANIIMTTHALRAKVIVEILKEKGISSEAKLLIDGLNCTIDYSQIMLVKYFYENFESIDEIIEIINKNDIENWTTMASIISGLLWLDIYRLYKNNIEEIDKGNELTNNTFIPLVLGDVTGYFKHNSRERNIENMAKFNANFLKIKDNVDFEKINLDYKYTDVFLGKIVGTIENKTVRENDNLSEIGFILFWLSNRNFYIKDINIEKNNFSNINQVLDFLIGLKVQKLEEKYQIILEKIKAMIVEEFSIVILEENEEEINVKFINKLDKHGDKSFNDRTMEVVNSVRRMYWGKNKYNVKMIGTKLYDHIKVFDTEKHIESQNLPIAWVSDVNGWLLAIDDFKNRKNDWAEYKKCMDELNSKVLEFLEKYNKALDYFYRTGNIKKITDSELIELTTLINKNINNMNKTPQCTTNIYGLKNDFQNKIGEKLISSVGAINKSGKTIEKFFYDFLECFRNFLNQKDYVIIAKIKKNEDKNTRLSYFNIVNAVEKFLDYKNEYGKTYKENDINEKVYKELKTLTLLWECFSKEEFRKQSNKLYNIKLIQKKKERELKEYISENIEPLKIDYGWNENICIDIDIFELDNTLKKLYDNYKEKFPDSELYNYDGFLLKEFEQSMNRNILITLKCDGRYMPNFLKLKLSQFLYIKDINELLKYLVPEENENLIKMENDLSFVYKSVKIVLNIENLIPIYNYIASVNKEIEEYNENIQLNVYNNWIKDMKKTNEELFTNLIESIQEVFDEINKINDIYKEYMDSYIKSLKEYKELSEEIVKQSDVKEMCDIDAIRDFFCEIMDKIVSF